MLQHLSVTESIIRASLGRVFGAAQLEVRQGGRTLLSQAYGWLDPETRDRPANQDTLFDLASVTKLFVATAFMTLVEEGRVGLDQLSRRFCRSSVECARFSPTRIHLYQAAW